MASIVCSACNRSMSDNSDSLYYKARYIPDAAWDSFWDEIDAAIEQSGPSAREKEEACMKLRNLSLFRSMFQCPDCGNLIAEDSDRKHHEFKPSGSTNNNLFDLDNRMKK